MTKEQIETYEYCKSHIAFLDGYLKELPFNSQKYGCGSQRPNIEHSLEKTHNKMYNSIINVIETTKSDIQSIIDKL